MSISEGRPNVIHLNGVKFQPAIIEGNVDIFKCPDFKIVKREWQPDNEALICPLCKCKFGGLKRRHHCRQCGLVVCNKCCNEKVLLPQLGLDISEKVCESCRPVTILVTKSRSTATGAQLEAAQKLAEMCKDSDKLTLLLQFGGFHTMLSLGSCHLASNNIPVLGAVVSGLHTMVTYEPLHDYMVNVGVIGLLCEVLDKLSSSPEEQVLLDGISALMIFCKSQKYVKTVLTSGGVTIILSLCSNVSDTVALLSSTSLSMMMEHPDTHSELIDTNRLALNSLLGLVNSGTEQMMAVTLKVLNYLSMGSEWHKHRIVQEDFTAGKPLKSVLQSDTSNMQVMANAACLVANLATNKDDQVSLVECRDCLIDILNSDRTNVDLMTHVTRGLANFAMFKYNSDKLLTVVPVLLSKCFSNSHLAISGLALRAVLHLISHDPVSTVKQLDRENASGQILTGLVGVPDMMTTIFSILLKQTPNIAKPL